MKNLWSERTGDRFRSARVEFLKGVRSLLDDRIDRLSRRSEKGTPITVEQADVTAPAPALECAGSRATADEHRWGRMHGITLTRRPEACVSAFLCRASALSREEALQQLHALGREHALDDFNAMI
jgi:hypothetical protein